MRHDATRRCLAPILGLLLAWPAGARAQAVVRDVERLAADRPEAWAMNYVTVPTIATGFGATPDLRAGQWRADADLGHIPRLEARQQRVGFGGEKAEDLNKSPVFARLRGSLGLGAGWVAELGWTPPLRIDGSRTRDLFVVALGRRVLQRDAWSASARAFGQHGAAEGDITCPAQVAGPFDPERNPFGCIEASRDRIALNHYGFDATLAVAHGGWTWHATLGAVRNEPAVQVDARVFTVRDRSYLIARAVLPYLALGAKRALGERWEFGIELLHVPLQVRRPEPDREESDPFTALRLRLGWQPHDP
jgi:hypothetical protein